MNAGGADLIGNSDTGELHGGVKMKGYIRTAGLVAATRDFFGFSGVIGKYLLKLLRIVIMMILWKDLFARGADTGGMTVQQVLSYTLMGAVLEPMLDVRTPVSDWLHSGSILSNYLRPMGVFTQLTLHTIGSWVQPLIVFSLPAMVIGTLLGIPVLPVNGWAFVSLLLAISQGFAVDYLFACVLIRMKNLSWTVHSLRNALTLLLTGAVIPFSLLPWGLGEVLQYTPLGTLAGSVLAVYTGMGDLTTILIMQVVWNVVLWPLSLYCFGRSRERIVSYGG